MKRYKIPLYRLRQTNPRQKKICSYFDDVRITWREIEAAVGQAPTADDVRILEGKCPRFSESDAAEIKARLGDGSLFPTAEPDRRKELLEHLFALPRIIKTLRTFFKDAHVMEEVVPCIYHIVDKKPKLSCSQILREAFQKSSGFEMAERKLWILTRTMFCQLPAPAARPDNRLLAKPRPGFPTPDALHKYAAEACRLGFMSDKIHGLQAVRPEAAIAKQALLSARKSPTYNVQDRHITFFQNAMYQVCRDIVETPHEPPGRTAFATAREKPRYVCGFPDTLSFKRDIENLHDLYHATEPIRDLHLSSLFRLQSFCYSFFRTPTELEGISIPGELAEGPYNVAGGSRFRADEPGTILGKRPREQDFRDGELDTIIEERQYGQSDDERGVHRPSTQEDVSTVIFMTLAEEGWRVLQRVEGTKQDVESAAKALSPKFSLLAITNDARMAAGITPEECFDQAAASGINTVLALPRNYHPSAIQHHIHSLYPK